MWNKYETEVFRAIGEDRLTFLEISKRIYDYSEINNRAEYYMALKSLYDNHELICIVEGNKVMYEKRNKSIQGSNI